ncbi:MAG: hypothetical protein PF513_07360 [Tenericutes bacterium]|jgi:hypothetical protein|nr:hypothetical protein [Mycoplasmatota bacterium]
MILNIMASIDLLFYFILGIAIFFGFLRGFKKSLFTFVVMAIFYILFFVTLNAAVNMIWSMNLSFLGGMFGNIDPGLSSFQSFESDYQLIIQTFFNNSFDFTQPEMDLLAVGIMQFAVKIIWAIVYFTVILLLYKIITGIIRMIFIKAGKPKKRLFGSIVGGLNGAMAVFVTLIVLGGTVSFIESVTILMDNEPEQLANNLVYEPRTTILELNQSIIPEDNVIELAETDPVVDPAMVDTMNELVDNYHKNIIVKLANTIKVDSTFNATEKVPLHIDLFDRVLSFKYGDDEIALRHEISIFMNAYNVIQASEYGNTQKITDIKGEDIREAFTYLESSILLPTALPIGIKYYSNQNDINLSVTDDELFNYNYTTEIERLSNILAGVFDILNEQETSIDEDGNEVVIDGAWVRDVFTDVSESRVVLLATESILVPMIEEGNGESEILQIIALPNQISWEDEYVAIGNILAEMIDAGISIQDIESTDLNTVLETFASIDASVIVGSKLISEGLINILSGETSLEGLDALTVPQDITWRSTDTETGELEYVLVAIQALINEMDNLDFDNVDIDLLTGLDDETIVALLDSYIIRATMSDQINTFELGTYQLVIPDNTIDSQGYYIKAELDALVESIQLLADVDGFSIDTLYTLTDSDLDILFASSIIQATVSDIVLDQAALSAGATATLIVPASVRENIVVNTQTIEQIELDELKAMINALNTLNITDLDGGIDSSIITSVSSSDINTIIESESLHATISNLIDTFELGVYQLVIPDNTKDSQGYYTGTELVAIIEGIQLLSDVDNFSIEILYTLSNNNLDTLFTSNIIQATISDIILDQATLTTTTPPTLTVPGTLRENIVVDTLTMEQIELAELKAIITALNTLGTSNFDGGINPLDITSLSTGDLTTILNSGSLHATIDGMLQDNSALIKPDFILSDLYGFTDVVQKAAIINFIEAAQELGETDISSASLNFATIATLTASEQATILESAIVRATITPDVETVVTNAALIDPYTGTWNYETVGNVTLTQASIQGVIDQYY